MSPPRKPTLPEAPQHTFGSIAGHGLVKEYLNAAFQSDVLPHALLFHGPKGLGKYSMAHALAKRVNCADGAPDNCPCNVCRKISEGTFADIVTIDPKGAAGQITLTGWKPGKDDPENLQYYRFVDTRPLEGARKFLILRQAERMNIALANYILKLMEEPPSYLTLVLISHRRNDLLSTIRSRCAPVKFSPVTLDEIRPIVKALLPGATGAEVEAFARLGDGRPGQLLEAAADGASQNRANVARLMRLFQQYGFLGLFRVASELQQTSGSAKGGGAGQENMERILSLLYAWLRDAAVLKTASPEAATRLLVNSDVRPELEAFAKATSLESISRAAELLPEIQALSARQIDRNYLLEMLLMKMGRAMRG